MAIDAKITQSLGGGFVQVDTTNKYGYKRYYKVPNRNARKLAKELVVQDKNMNLYSNITYFSSIFIGVIAASMFTKNMDSKWKQFGIQTMSAIGLSLLASLGMNEYEKNKHSELIKSYKAREIFYKA